MVCFLLSAKKPAERPLDLGAAQDGAGSFPPSSPAGGTAPESARDHLPHVTPLTDLAGDADEATNEDKGVCDQARDGSDLPSSSPSQASSPKPFSSRWTRPNAPVVLVVYRSGGPLPGRLRRDLETAAARAAGGGVRLGFLGAGEAVRVGGDGMDEEGTSRLGTLGARLSRLLAAADTGRFGNSQA